MRFNEHLLSLSLVDCEMGPEGASFLAGVLKIHPTLTHLSVKHNPIGPDGAEAIVKASRRNKLCGLSELDMYDCSLGPEGAVRVAAQLRRDTSLEELRLRFNNIGPTGAMSIASMLLENHFAQD